MKYQIVSIFDSAAGAYARSVIGSSVGMAMRSFEDECNRDASDNSMFHHPKDFSLVQLGSFDDNDGSLVGLDAPVILAHASDYRS